jgi:signal transduction histidine kinase
MSAEADRRRSAVFFGQYLALLAGAVAWVQFPEVRARVGGHLPLFYLLLTASACYVFLRAYVVLVRQAGRSLRDLWVTMDLGVITGAVYLTGGMNSEAGLLYFWPIATSAIQRQPGRTIAISAASGVLYFLSTWPDHGDPKYPGAMMARFVVLIIVSSLAVSFALAETVRIEEVTRLREQVALANDRSRLSQEVHDGVLGSLDGVALRLDLIRKLAGEDPAEAARLATDQRFSIRQVTAELRHLVQVLRSATGARAEFAEALRHHISIFAEGSRTAARLEIEGEVRPLPAQVEREAFRIVQEAMVNAEKHARATEVRVRLCYAENAFACSIRDNGVGFDTAAPPEGTSPAGGFGLPSMTQRAESVGGELRITSAPGEGTEVAFTVPLAAPAEALQKGA